MPNTASKGVNLWELAVLDRFQTNYESEHGVVWEVYKAPIQKDEGFHCRVVMANNSFPLDMEAWFTAGYEQGYTFHGPYLIELLEW